MILFLDFDGVLHVPRVGRTLEYVPLLEAALQPYPDIKIVISSSWQGYFKHDDFEVFLGPLAPRLVGVTSSAPLSAQVKASLQLSNWPALQALAQRREHQHLAPPGVRQRAIEAWMAANAHGERWLALDDVAANFDADCRRAVILDLRRNPPAAEYQKLVTALANSGSIPPLDDFPIRARIHAQMGKNIQGQGLTDAPLSFFNWWRMAASVPVLGPPQRDADQYIQLEAVPPVWRGDLTSRLVARDGPPGEVRLADWCDFLSTTLVRMHKEQGLGSDLLPGNGSNAHPTAKPVVLFLDIDGVLHLPLMARIAERQDADGNRIGHRIYGSDMYRWAPLLIEVLEEFPDVRIVVHSNWRLMVSFGTLLASLPVGIARKVIAITPTRVRPRWDSIQAYCAVEGIDRFVVIDNSPKEFPENLPNLVACHHIGLSDADVVARLRGRLKIAHQDSAPDGTFPVVDGS